MFVLDTNVLSELMRPEPDERVVGWVAAQPRESLFTTSITQAELMTGLMRLPQGRRRRALEEVVRGIFEEDLGGRVLAFDTLAARRYATLMSQRLRAGRPMQAFDAQIAAIAGTVNATLVTRNTRDFTQCGIELVDPWEKSVRR